ncbi:MAG TPA: hypothetical protein PLZ79_03860 [Burkholderiales bacterium]|nr:hypothetical protein [Burkholderiales bacterium]
MECVQVARSPVAPRGHLLRGSRADASGWGKVKDKRELLEK